MAFTTIPGAGQKVRGSVLSSLITELRPLSGIVTGDQALATSSTVLQDVTSAVVPVAANHVYRVFLNIAASLSSGAVEDIKVGFTFPTGATLIITSMGGSTAGVVAGSSGATDMNIPGGQSFTSGSTAVGFGVGTTATGNFMVGILTMGSTAGNLQTQAAQNNSGVNTVTVKAGTFLEAQMLS